MTNPMPICTATTRAGKPCRNHACPGSPFCSVHGGQPRARTSARNRTSAPTPAALTPAAPTPAAPTPAAPTPAAPTPEPKAARRSFYSADAAAVTIDEAIAGFVDKMTRLDALDAAAGDAGTLLRIFGLYTSACSRLARLLRDRRALSGEAADGIAGAVSQALDELKTELNADL